jgi:hypothetical protein
LQFVYAFGVFVLASMAHAGFSLAFSDSPFLVQGLVLPAIVALKLTSAALALDWDLGWLDIDVKSTAAGLGRSIAFGATGLFVYVPAQLYRRRPTRRRKMVALAPWIFIALSLAAAALLFSGMEAGWRD